MSVWKSLDLVLLSFLEVITLAIEWQRARPLLCVLCLFKTIHTFRIDFNFFFFFFCLCVPEFLLHQETNLPGFSFPTVSFLHILSMSHAWSLHIDQIWDPSSACVFRWHIQGVKFLTPRFISLFPSCHLWDSWFFCFVSASHSGTSYLIKYSVMGFAYSKGTCGQAVRDERKVTHYSPSRLIAYMCISVAYTYKCSPPSFVRHFQDRENKSLRHKL